jgi:hypothetical protein
MFFSGTLEFSHFGGQFIKDVNLSPDAFVQLALQLTNYKMFGTNVPYVTAVVLKESDDTH